MANYGYARVSTADQNLDRQLKALREAGATAIFTDKKSGKNTDRPQLQELLDTVQEGDTVIITALSRLGRSTVDLIQLMDRFDKAGVHLRSLKEHLDSSTPAGRMMFKMIAVFAEFEREMIVDRVVEGLERARERGEVLGRPVTDKNDSKIERAKQMLKEGWAVKDILEETGLSKNMYYRRVKGAKYY